MGWGGSSSPILLLSVCRFVGGGGERGGVSPLWRAAWSLWYLWLLLRSHMRRPRRNKHNRPQLWFHLLCGKYLQTVIVSGRNSGQNSWGRRGEMKKDTNISVCLSHRWQEGWVWTSRSGGVSSCCGKRCRWDQFWYAINKLTLHVSLSIK